MNNKILFADLDRTLLCDDKSISEKNRAAIQKMLERGHYFVLATMYIRYSPRWRWMPQDHFH